MNTPDYKVVKRGIFVPKGLLSGQDLVYNEKREIVEESCLLRGENKSENISNPPELIPDTVTISNEFSNRRLLFLGDFQQVHYGHLITEGISRYWYLRDDAEDQCTIPTTRNPFEFRGKVQSLIKPRGNRWRTVLDKFGLEADDFLIVPADHAVQAKEIIVPNCSMYNRCEIHEVHLAISKRIASNMLGSTRTEYDATPVYLSRVKTRRVVNNVRNEGPIEEYCRTSGFKIIYPERLSLKKQIDIFNRHDVFIGFIGSAFHTLLFRTTDRKATNIYLAYEHASSNYKLIDELMQNSSYYVQCAHGESKRTFVCDPDKAIRGIRDVMRTLP